MVRVPKVVAKGLTKRYGSVTAADGIDLVVREEEIVGIVGPNGAGKTTTIEMMEGLRRPDAGVCTICGFDSVAQNAKVRQLIGLSLQHASMSDELSVRETLTLYASLYEDPVPVGDLLHQFDLEEKANAWTAKLSGGQRQRLALALAIIGRPQVVFLDEPTTGLDPQARRKLWDVIRGLRDDGRSVVLTTHYMDEVERLCDRVVVMDQGRILAEGEPRQLTARYGPESVIEVELDTSGINTVQWSRLDAVTGIKMEAGRIQLQTADTPLTLMGLATLAKEAGLPLRDLRTRAATMDDVFMALTRRGVRD